MSLVENFLSPEEEQAVIIAIREAEKNTSGEIRVHLETHCPNDIIKRVHEVFHYLKMDNTKLQNGVLIYVAVADNCFYIHGDVGINNVVPKNFWETTKETIQQEFVKGNFKQGLVNGILSTGKQLEKHFPWHHFDTDELSNEISKE